MSAATTDWVRTAAGCGAVSMWPDIQGEASRLEESTISDHSSGSLAIPNPTLGTGGMARPLAGIGTDVS